MGAEVTHTICMVQSGWNRRECMHACMEYCATGNEREDQTECVQDSGKTGTAWSMGRDMH